MGQFLILRTLLSETVRPTVYVVTEMFAFNGATSSDYLVGVEANMMIDPSSNNWDYFRDEQQLWLEFYSYYVAD